MFIILSNKKSHPKNNPMGSITSRRAFDTDTGFIYEYKTNGTNGTMTVTNQSRLVALLRNEEAETAWSQIAGVVE